MEDLNVDKILYTLKEFNEELTYSRDTINKLNEYNISFINKLLSLKTNLTDEENEFYTKLDSILIVIEQKKKQSTNELSSELEKNEVVFNDKYNTFKDIYDQEIRNITTKIDNYTSSFEKEINNITNSTYYKTLEVNHTKSQYDNYLNDIKEHYLQIMNYFFSKKQFEMNSISDESLVADKELNDTFEKIQNIFKREIKQIEDEKQESILNIKQRQSEKEKELLNKKIDVNKKLEDTSSLFKDEVIFSTTPFKNHINYLQEKIELLNKEELSKENSILEEFKTDLELIDKEIEVFKEESSKLETLTGRKKAAFESKINVFNESMRTKKIEIDSIKSYNIKKLKLDYEYKRNIILKNIELIQFKISSIESICSLKEYISLSHIRHNMELDEITIKTDLDYIKQELYLIENQDKLNHEYFNTIHDYQIKLHKDASSFNTSFFENIKNNISTLNTLEIEKNLILKKYNIELNSNLVKKVEQSVAMIKLDESLEIKNKRSDTELKKKILSQDVQLANKKFSLQKMLINLEKEFFSQNIINESRFKLEGQTYKIFENRFVIEKKLYELYFKSIVEVVELYSHYFDKYNTITRCTNKNITITTYNYLLSTLQECITSLINKIVSVITDRINFEGSINFQYELTKLLNERDQHEKDYEISNNKMTETISNYQKTIDLYKRNIELLDREIYKTENSIALKNMDISKDSKLSNSNNRITNEINTLKENILNYKKEQKNFKEIILKNEKSINELTKSIIKHKKRYTKISDHLKEQLENIEKRHKVESSVYYKFIDKIESYNQVLTSSTPEVTVNDNIQKNFQKFISNMMLISNEFRTTELDNLINELNFRHELLLEKSELKKNDRSFEINETYKLDVKNTCTAYNNEVLEIEKKLDKVNDSYLDTNKENLSNYKDRANDIKTRLRNLDISITQGKAELLYNINSFNENIKSHASFNEKNITSLKGDRKNLAKEYYRYSDSLTSDRKNKRNNIINIHNNVINSLKISYKNIINDKKQNHKKKEHSYLSQINELELKVISKTAEFDNYIVTSKIEYDLAANHLNQALDNSLTLIKKRSLSKINKENKKYLKNKSE